MGKAGFLGRSKEEDKDEIEKMEDDGWVKGE